MKTIKPLKNTTSLVLTYTVLFCLTMAGIFALFILHGKSFVNHADAYDQGYFWTVEMRNNLDSLFSGKGYPLWSWDRGMGMDTKLPIDPFLILAAIFPVGSVELGYTVAIVLRLYFAGLAFIFFCKQVDLDNFQALIGSLFYVASAWTINTALIQGQFMGMMIIFPLLVASVDRILQGKSPWLFIATVAFAVALNYYLAYMAAIGVIIYLILRYFHYNEFKPKSYFAYLGRFVLYGSAGIMIAAVFVLITIRTVMGASTGSGNSSVSALYDTSFYLTSGIRMISKGYSFNYTNIGLPILGLLVLFVPMAKPSIKHTHGIMTAIMLVMTLFPFFGSMFNGFSYVSNRWYFMLIFFLAWTAAEHLDLDKLGTLKRSLLMLVWWAVLVFTTLGFGYLDITGNFGKKELGFIAGNLAAGFVMILVIFVGKKILPSIRARQTLITMCVIGALVLSWTCSFLGRTGFYFKYGAIQDKLDVATQRAGSQIEDTGFYRIDQVDWLNVSKAADQPVNENLYWRNNTLYVYDSKLPSSLTQFNKLVGNNLGYSKRVYMQSNGNRVGLDFLLGVRYFLGDDTKNDRTGADAYAPYGFAPAGNIDGVNVFKNRYDATLGYTFTTYMPESEFLRLNRLQREQALMQTIIIPDRTLIGDPDDEDSALKIKDAVLTNADAIETDIADIPYTIKGTDGVMAAANEGNTPADGVSADTFTVEKEGGTVTLHVEDAPAGQLVVSFDNLKRFNADGKEVGNFYLSCANDKLNSDASNTKNNQTIADIVDFDLNMGYCNEYTGDLTISFSVPGTYTFDKLYVSSMSTELYEKYAATRMDSAFVVDSYDNTIVTGTVDAAKGGLLFISLPVYDNWEVYIDGNEEEVIGDADIAFMAVQIPAGHHDVELRYDNKGRMIALGISGAGVLLAVLLCIFGRKRRREIRKEFADLKEINDDLARFSELAEEETRAAKAEKDGYVAKH